MKKRYLVFGGVAVLLIANVFFWYLVINNRSSEKQKDFPLLAKRLTVDNPNDNIVDFQPLRSEIQNYLKQTGIDHSYYFEYLPTGVSIRSGETNQLVAASLMKLPLVMDVYKLSEQGAIKLDDKITITDKDIDNKVGFGNTSNLKAGDKITYREAAKLSLTESDNTASLALYRETKDKLPQDKQAISFLDLEINYESANDREDYVYISSKSYSSILKCLYLSCYNNYNSSNEILQYLTNSKNRDRLASGINDKTPVANKIGVFQNKVQSDCAVVYEPKRPYLVCLMFFTDGKTADVNQYFKKVAELTQNYIKSIER